MARITPPLRIKGVFSLRAPFSAKPGVAYTVQAIRSFEEIRARNSDPMTLVYGPAGLLKVHYDEDVAAGAAIVTLMSASEAPIYVPDTYIDSYPDMGNIEYSHLIASVSLGPLPSTFDTTLLKSQIANVVAGTIGVAPTVHIGVAALNELVSSETHAQLVAARKGAITIDNTDRSRALRAEDTVAKQALHIQTLEAYILTLLAQIPPPPPTPTPTPPPTPAP
jgi:hypothetical protein